MGKVKNAPVTMSGGVHSSRVVDSTLPDLLAIPAISQKICGFLDQQGRNALRNTSKYVRKQVRGALHRSSLAVGSSPEITLSWLCHHFLGRRKRNPSPAGLASSIGNTSMDQGFSKIWFAPYQVGSSQSWAVRIASIATSPTPEPDSSRAEPYFSGASYSTRMAQCAAPDHTHNRLPCIPSGKQQLKLTLQLRSCCVRQGLHPLL
jgi:hypothetical protein